MSPGGRAVFSSEQKRVKESVITATGATFGGLMFLKMRFIENIQFYNKTHSNAKISPIFILEA